MAETRMVTCSRCGEQDYLDFTATIDGKRYCNQCWHEVMGESETVLIEQKFKERQRARGHRVA